ncbi:class I SAM-dependent methyltransferase [Salinisphaera sp.]|uniref:class I SAM-dependent methyltransferase n=1 Tax=Salinisphaera sp. TaxID=1914330 RepID=UPI002D78E77E|nr:class I SAM-dependent methyltransferase [Salinisphaera sp.]HET7314091.1 class I SAM-dependent methyltransferase [Salinisphaera sp.]
MTPGETEKIADIGSSQPDLDASTDRYANRFRGKSGEWLLSRQTAAVRKLLKDDQGANVLDVGGGHGQIAAPLLADGHAVTVHASSEAALAQVQRLDHPALTLSSGPLMPLPFAERSFDIVTSFRIMAHIGDWRRFLAELARVARRAVIVDFPIPSGANALEPLLFGLKKRIEGDTRRFDTIRKADARRSLKEAGFPHATEIGQFVLPIVVHRKLGMPGVSSVLEKACGGVGLASALGTPVILRANRADAEPDTVRRRV